MLVKRKLVFLLSLCCVAFCGVVAQDTQATRVVGAVTAVKANVITLKSDAGADLTITVIEGARVLRTAPGQSDLKTATPILISEIQTGDRVLARGKASADGRTLEANTVVVMKQSDVTAKQKKEEEDWQRRGVFGPVKAFDAATGIVTLGATTPGTHGVTVQTSKNTIVRKYAPDSPHFDDAKPSTLGEIKPGDQLRARGTRSPDGSSLAAEEIVFGTFRNVAGTIASIDVANQTITVNDLDTKKPVVVKITADVQMHRLPQMVAQAIAFRLRGGEMPGAPNGAPQGGQRPQGAQPPAGGFRAAGPGGPGGPGGGRAMGNADLSQMLARMPQLPLSELQKGDALMIVTTQGSGTTVSAITLLAGVEAILTAPNATSILSPWNMNTGGAGDAQ